MTDFTRRPPLRLNLDEYRLVERLINDVPELELTEEEVNLRRKVRAICRNIERAIEFKKRQPIKPAENNQ